MRLSKALAKAILVSLFCAICTRLGAQDLEPRIYGNLPKKMNAVAFVYGLAWGNVVTDPSLPIEDFKITTHNLGAGYVRTFGLLKKLSRIQVSLPYTRMEGSLKIDGRDTGASRSGFGDLRIRFGMNLIGSPALDKKEFREYQQKTIFGASLVVSVPTGLYYPGKRINIGAHRWALKPEIGVSRRFKHIYAEVYSGIWFYTKNDQYLVNKVQAQRPVLSLQGHGSYYFKNQMWIGINANWFNGGETTIDGAPVGDLKDNWRIGATWSVPISKGHSLKLQFNVGAFTHTGLDYNMISLAYQYVFF